MSYAETQNEIIRAQMRGRPPAAPHVMSALASSLARPTSPTAPAPRPAVTPAAAVARADVRPIVESPADAGSDDDLAAAVAAARRLRFTADVEQILAAAGVTLEQMRGRGKTRGLVEVRRIVAAYLRRRGCSLPEIGRVLNRDHTSVLHLLRTPTMLAGVHEEPAP